MLRALSTDSPVSRLFPRERPLLCLVTDTDRASRERIACVEAAFRGGLDWVQIRDREAPAGTLFLFATALQSIAQAAGGQIAINRRLDVARALGADAVHLGYDALGPDRIAPLWLLMGEAPSPLVGVSAHSVSEAERALNAEADYAHLAPIFTPLSKTSARPALGLEPLRDARARGLSVIAQGGVEPRNAAEVIEAGALGIAVTGAILNAADPAAETRALREAVDQARRTPRPTLSQTT